MLQSWTDPTGESGELSWYSNKTKGLNTDKSWFNFRQRQVSSPAVGPTQPRIQKKLGAPPPRVKRPLPDADHSSPTSKDVKNEWSYTSTRTDRFWHNLKCGHEDELRKAFDSLF